MARPQKCGMDYFPHDTDALTDEKIEALRMLYGNDGYAFYFILLERIYRTEHFELDVSDAETIQILSRKIGVELDKFNLMLATAIKRNCFDNEAYNERQVLTSIGIKKRADVVIAKRISSKKSYDTKVSVAETTQETTPESTQRKGKERKGEGIKELYESVFNHYIKADLVKHKTITDDIKKAIDRASKELSLDADYMKRIIDRHSEKVKATQNNGQYATKQRTLAELFGQKKHNSVSLICTDYLDEVFSLANTESKQTDTNYNSMRWV